MDNYHIKKNYLKFIKDFLKTVSTEDKLEYIKSKIQEQFSLKKYPIFDVQTKNNKDFFIIKLDDHNSFEYDMSLKVEDFYIDMINYYSKSII